jgi:hypothetical protein
MSVRIACFTLLAGFAGALVAAQPLSSSNAGTWQFVPLPAEWIERNWPQPKPEEAYIALRGPHPADLGKYAPCYEPPRLMVGVVRRGTPAREHLLACIHYCKSDDAPGRAAGGLWARETHLEGITAQILDNGTIEVFQHFRHLAETPPTVERDVRVVNKLRFQDEPRVRDLHFTAANLAAAAAKRGAESCLGQ